jgi:O-antigen/teichoic acid export membrane protein
VVYSKQGRGLLAKNSVLNLLGQVLPMLVGIVTIPRIVRGLGADGYGILSIAFMVLGYFSIFDLGLSRATVKFVAEHLNPDQIHKVPGLVWTSLGLLVGLGCAGGALAAAFVPLAVTHYLKMPPSFVGEARLSLFILCASMPVMLSNDALRGVLEATQRFDLVNCVKIPGSVCFYLFAAIAAAAGMRVSGVVLLLVLIRLSTSFAYLALCFRVLPNLRKSFGFSRESLAPLATFGGWIMVSNVAGPMFGSIERFIIAAVVSVGALTYYSVPFDLVTKVLIFPASIAPALFPYFSFHGGRRSEVSAVTSKSVKYLLLLMTPVTAIFCVFAKDILRLWMGPQFAVQSAVVMQLVALSCFLSAFAYIPYTSVQALGRPDLKAKLDMVLLPAYAALAWWLARRVGINGGALAKLVITAVDGAALFIIAWKMKAFSPRDCFSGPLLRAQGVSGLLFLGVAVLGLFQFNLLRTGGLLVALLAGYAAAFWAVAVESNERKTLLGLYRRLPFMFPAEEPSPMGLP